MALVALTLALSLLLLVLSCTGTGELIADALENTKNGIQNAKKTLLGTLPVDLSSPEGVATAVDFELFQQGDPWVQVREFCNNYAIVGNECEVLEEKVLQLLPTEKKHFISQTSVTNPDVSSQPIVSIPLSMHVKGSESKPKDIVLHIFAGEDATYQTQEFCRLYDLSVENCTPLTDLVLEKFQLYLSTLEEDKRTLLQQRKRHDDYVTSVNLSPNFHFPDTIQQCDPVTKTCRFRNLYFDTATSRFFINNCNPFNVIETSQRFFSLTCRDSFHEDKKPDNYNFTTKCLTFLIDHQLLPQQKQQKGDTENIESTTGESVRTVYANKTVLLARRFSPHNPGHFRLEIALPLVRLANLYDLNEINKTAILFDDDCFDEESIYWFEGNDVTKRNLCDHFTKTYISPLTNLPIHSTNSLKKSLYGIERFLHFPDVVLGIGAFSPWRISKATAYKPRMWSNMTEAIEIYRESMYQYAGVQVKNIQNEGNTVDKKIINSTFPAVRILTYVYKLGKRSVLNYGEIIIFLNDWCHNNNFDLKFMNLATTSLQVKMQIFSVTDMLITCAGSDHTSAIFLPRLHLPVIEFGMLNVNTEGKIYIHQDNLWAYFIKRYVYFEWIGTPLDDLKYSLDAVDPHSEDRTASFYVNTSVLGNMLENILVHDI